jgi:hypothetical protein
MLDGLCEQSERTGELQMKPFLTKGLEWPATAQEHAVSARVKVFNFVSGHGETIVQPPHEDHINAWLSELRGQLLYVSQSESEHRCGGHHVTVCVWYLPDEHEEAP